MVLADPAWLRRQIGVVLRENVLFNRKARENIALSDSGMNIERVISAALLAGAHEFPDADGQREEARFPPGEVEFVNRLPAGGNRIRTIGPASGIVVDAKFQRSDPGRSNPDFGRRW